MTDALMPANLALDGQAIVADVPCHRCGYNLRGLTVDTLCPECGTPVARSMYGNWLRFADTDWLNRLRLGVLVKLWSMLATVVLSFAVGMLIFVGVRMQIVQFMSLIGAALGAYGVFLLTTPEPSVAASEDPLTLRRLYRLAIITGLLVAPVVIALQRTAYHWPSAAFNAVSGIAGVVAMFCEFIYLRRLARRIPDERMASHTSIVMWGYGIAGGLGVVAGLAIAVGLFTGVIAFPAGGAGFGPGFPGAPVAPPPAMTVVTGAVPTVTVTTGVAAPVGPPAAGAATTVTVNPGAAAAPAGPPALLMVAFGVGGCVVGVAMLAFGIWYLVLLFGYLRAFREARDFSAALATAPPTQPQNGS